MNLSDGTGCDAAAPFASPSRLVPAGLCPKSRGFYAVSASFLRHDCDADQKPFPGTRFPRRPGRRTTADAVPPRPSSTATRSCGQRRRTHWSNGKCIPRTLVLLCVSSPAWRRGWRFVRASLTRSRPLVVESWRSLRLSRLPDRRAAAPGGTGSRRVFPRVRACPRAPVRFPARCTGRGQCRCAGRW
jgi:hypothetical protein